MAEGDPSVTSEIPTVQSVTTSHTDCGSLLSNVSLAGRFVIIYIFIYYILYVIYYILYIYHNQVGGVGVGGLLRLCPAGLVHHSPAEVQVGKGCSPKICQNI